MYRSHTCREATIAHPSSAAVSPSATQSLSPVNHNPQHNPHESREAACRQSRQPLFPIAVKTLAATALRCSSRQGRSPLYPGNTRYGPRQTTTRYASDAPNVPPPTIQPAAVTMPASCFPPCHGPLFHPIQPRLITLHPPFPRPPRPPHYYHKTPRPLRSWPTCAPPQPTPCPTRPAQARLPSPSAKQHGTVAMRPGPTPRMSRPLRHAKAP